MDLVKEEKYSLCQACLSNDRLRKPLDENYALYMQLLGDPEKYTHGVTKDLLLCWECTARLNSLRTFQNRIKNAQQVLQQYMYQLNETPQSLSTLKVEITDHYDHLMQNDLTNIIILSHHTCDTEIKSENQDKKDVYDDIDNEINDYDNDNEIVDNNIISEIDKQIDYTQNLLFENENQSDYQPIKLRRKERKKKKEKSAVRKIRSQVSIRKYEKYALVDKKLNIEGDDLKKWYTKMKLSEKEMEDVLNKDRVSKATWRFEKKCKDCHIVYRRSIDLKRHIAFHHLKAADSLRCAQCRAKCTCQSDLKRHWLSAHTCVYKCVACDVTCRDSNEMSRHVNKEHTAVYKCVECGVTRSTLRNFSEHYKESHENVVCDYCSRSFHKKTTLIKHIKYKHTAPICDICNRMLQNHKALTKHRYIVHAITVRGPQPRDLAYCVECDKQFPTIYKYKYHLSQSPRHQNKNKFMKACPECGKVFSRTACMNHHYKLVHLKDTRYKCDICNKCFAMNSRLKQHQRIVHQKIGLPKNKMCDICGRGFTTNRILIEHRRTHTGERPYKCGYCECAFAQKGAMLVHQRTQHKNVLHNNE
ncbi:hypothetical protein K1T71_000707 [Dendrolimus kikuchii]|uniref:Uncharacterized protein n=1 Tax=Dendrolimus kikuchii TaxID=765133 RepID=A0ACC1DKK2_9NEOP|nr:hypothetical protein K1T71_000707 [Dendrolimus kikuchii]